MMDIIENGTERTPARYLVTSALPYANGPVHIGHLAGVYIPADIYVRYLRLKGRDVVFIGGSDEHGVPITIKARKEGVSPRDVVDKYHGLIKDSFERFGISFDIYSRTTSEIHRRTASDFFRKLFDAGEFVEQSSEQYFDVEASLFLADRYITGGCPRCGADNAYGDQCEACGSTLSPMELLNPRSTISGSVPVLRKTSHWYLPLDRYQAWLERWILEEHKEWKPNVYGQCKSWLDQGLQPRAVSRDLSWGVPVPVEGAEGKVLYVWFDAPIGYISNTRELLPDSWELYWKDGGTRLVHFIGKDNIVFHCIVFPAMLRAHGGYILPDNVPANEFLNLEGKKISTTRNHAVWLHEYLDDFPGKEDALRYALCANAPETKDNDFTWADFQSRNNNELVAVAGNFVNRAMVLTHKYFKGTIPARGELEEIDLAVARQIPEIIARVETMLETFKFREALKSVMDIARVGNKYLADTEPWKLSDSRRIGTVLNLALQICANLAVALAPFLPFAAAKLAAMLRFDPPAWDGIGGVDLLAPGHDLDAPQHLFEKIDDETVARQTKKLRDRELENAAAAANLAPQKDVISAEEFERADIRLATVVAAERVAGTDKLMKLTVDTGIDRRALVSGIADVFAPEELTGKQIPVIVNLAPRKIRGIESRGMIAAVRDASGKLALLHPSNRLPDGSTIG
ncbi:MAG: methionine--tRNA ligase [Prevotellaceae bacterium]|jgi:methionyl-tRNA synthetase|nr:methionine--tRNA ligase [Prevotellaceae bacterium]